MKNNALFLRVALGIVVGYMPMLSMATTLEIVNLAPDKAIKIGSRDCYIGDTINAKDIIHWDRSLANQFIEVICQKDCPEVYKKVRECSMRDNDKKSGVDLSFYDIKIKGMVSKGEENRPPFKLWPGKLLLIEGMRPENGYEYYCRVQGDLRKFDLIIRDNGVYLRSDDFKDYEVEFILEIYKKSLTNAGDISKIMALEVEQVK